MARWRRIAWCAGLGVATTVGVAWMASVGWLNWAGNHQRAVKAERRVTEAPNVSEHKVPVLEVLRRESPGCTYIALWTGSHNRWLRDYVPTATTPEELAAHEMLADALFSADWRDAPRGTETVYWQCGWPLRAVQCRFGPKDPMAVVAPTMGVYVRDASPPTVEALVVPLAPIWAGLVLDSLLFGAAWWVLLSAPLTARYWLRRRRGRCPQCGYSRSGLAPESPCPECGKAAASAPAPLNTSTA